MNLWKFHSWKDGVHVRCPIPSTKYNEVENRKTNKENQQNKGVVV
jgi:hypothetical protein